MSKQDLHPSVQRFKQFVHDHPRVKNQLRKNHKLIQSYYEKWMILGEEDSFWSSLPPAKEEEQANKMEWIKQLGVLVEDINWEEVSRQMDELGGAIGQFQQIISDVKKDRPKPQVEYPYY
ncbi:YlbD family protein [Halobacillus litoralis]|uniref:YlbD family protein n=1 Tax=Halobacillus litoralis TaxID=45668 RepID=UPI001CD26390|nr:YlbD family protein [Halobacillus litoralis]MCA0969396.1 YlbD family protein [Halobacillus litoralis]